MSSTNTSKRGIAIILIVALGLLLGIAIYQYLAVFVGAFILFVIFAPLNNKLLKKNWGKNKSALFIILLTFLLVVSPAVFIGSLAVQEVIELSNNRDSIINQTQSTVELVSSKLPAQISAEDEIREIVQSVTSYLQSLLGPIVQGASQFIINIIMMYFVLFFLFTEGNKWKTKMIEYLPYSKKHNNLVLSEFTQISNATIVSTGIIAIIQGIIVYISLVLVGIESALIWGIVSTILAFLPVIGTPVVWIPASIYLVSQDQIISAIIFFLFHALITTNVDNILRPILNKKFGNIHPLTSFVGVFFGLYLFGIMGIILGPLLINYFFLSIKLYKLEFGD